MQSIPARRISERSSGKVPMTSVRRSIPVEMPELVRSGGLEVPGPASAGFAADGLQQPVLAHQPPTTLAIDRLARASGGDRGDHPRPTEVLESPCPASDSCPRRRTRNGSGSPGANAPDTLD